MKRFIIVFPCSI